jgi:hypothetical protein
MNSSFLVSARMIGIYHLLRHKFGMGEKRYACIPKNSKLEEQFPNRYIGGSKSGDAVAQVLALLLEN